MFHIRALYEFVDFRGESATPVPGTPEGLAVYMTGVRNNESHGDDVNWDLIPPSAISTAQIVTGNPIFGLNRQNRDESPRQNRPHRNESDANSEEWARNR